MHGGRREDINHRPRRRAWFGLKPFLSAWKPLRAGVSVTLPYAEGRRVDPARRACPISARAYGD
jgi:hypothetical protein